MNRGHFYAIAAYGLWGLLPIYWQQLSHVPATQVVAHRIVWSCAVLIPIIWLSGKSGTVTKAAKQPRVLFRQLIAALLICANWLGFVWAVTHGRMVESSLGYFINPLFSVLLAVVLLGERLRGIQWMAISIAAAGIGWLGWQYGTIPWIAILLASTFCLYGFVKKTTKLDPVTSLSIETWLLFIPAIGFIAWEQYSGRGGFLVHGSATDSMLLMSGIATTIPLLCFAAGAQRISLSTIGLLQYLGPTIQFLLGWLVYHEPFDNKKLIGFVFVWIALAIYATDSVIAARRRSLCIIEEPV
jgi:chloramphenicol-sensitive protein RarD